MLVATRWSHHAGKRQSCCRTAGSAARARAAASRDCADGERGRPALRLRTAGHWQDGDPDILLVFDAGYDVTRVACQRDGTTVLPRAWDHLGAWLIMAVIGRSGQRRHAVRVGFVGGRTVLR